jgi:hypothetical protein
VEWPRIWRAIRRATNPSVRDAFAAMASAKRLVLSIVPDPSAPSVDDDDGGAGEDLAGDEAGAPDPGDGHGGPS